MSKVKDNPAPSISLKEYLGLLGSFIVIGIGGNHFVGGGAPRLDIDVYIAGAGFVLAIFPFALSYLLRVDGAQAEKL